MADGRVLIAFADAALEPDPAWTRIDNTNSLVAGIDIRAGRQSEFDQTETSTATVYINDTDGLFDPDNTSSPYFGGLDGSQILLQLWNPVTDEWVPQYRGHVDDYGFDFNPATDSDGNLLVCNVAIQCVGLFDYLAGVEMIPGEFGDAAPPGKEGAVFYEDTDFQTRVTQILTDARLPPEFFVVFTGNVDVQESQYSPGESILSAARETVDAEMPTTANLYEDKQGRVCAHGRIAYFDPDTVSSDAGPDTWNFRRWKAGDGQAILLDGDRAQIRPPLSWSRPRSRIYNAALSYPLGIQAKDMAGQVHVSATSRNLYGYRSWSATDLIIQAGTTTGLTANQETSLYGAFIIANYKDPRTRVEALTFKAIRPDDPRGPATWALICGVDVSDEVELTHGYPGGEGLDETLKVQGFEMEIRPLNPGFDMVTVTLNVSPLDTDDVGLLG